MIEINNGVLVEGNMGRPGVKLLWELLNVIGSRFTFLAEAPNDDLSVSYSDKYEVVERQGNKIVLFNCADEGDFYKLIEVLGDWCVTDFHITINSFFDNVLNKVDSKLMFSEHEFLLDEYLIEFPRTVHIKENSFFIDFGMFKEYTYQLQRVAQRYMKNE